TATAAIQVRLAPGRAGRQKPPLLGSRTGRGSRGGAWRPLAVVPSGSTTRDSGNQRQAKITLKAHRPAATRPGTVSPQRAVSDASPGPTMTPALVAADSQPSALARSCGSMVSATYAWATPVVPPPRPCTKRDANSSQRALANPKMTYATADPVRPTNSTGRRP